MKTYNKRQDHEPRAGGGGRGRGGCVGMSRQSVFIINITNIVNTVITGTIVAGPQCDGKNVKVFKL